MTDAQFQTITDQLSTIISSQTTMAGDLNAVYTMMAVVSYLLLGILVVGIIYGSARLYFSGRSSNG